jgi:polyhydroxyalkanoate synthesis regulator phasin
VSEPSESRSESGEESRGERVGDALRTAVERTLAATAGSAAGTRQRAGELFDEVARRGRAASQEVARRGEAARGEATGRLADAISDLRLADRDDVRMLSERIGELEGRLGSLERLLRREADSKSQVEVEGSSGEADDEADPGV